MLVVDASVAVEASLAEDGFELLRGQRLVAPPLLWSEVPSVLHEMRWRGEITDALAAVARDRMDNVAIQRRQPARLLREAWRVADDLGWARTYDAEYVALARLLECPLLTLDARLQRGASRLVRVLAPGDL